MHQDSPQQVIRALRGAMPLILDFWAPWCAPCKQVDLELVKVSAKRPDIRIVKINVEEQRDLAQEWGVQTLPTLIYVPVAGSPRQFMGPTKAEDIVRRLNA